MAVPSSPASKHNFSTQKEEKKKKKKKKKSKKSESENACSSPRKRAKCPGVRVIGGRIYDSENGKTCHQCRQKTMDFTASCKNQKRDKLCTIKFCHKCLLNRYGEKAEEMAVLDDWKCPKCRGICNCSFCMKKRGHRPTGILVHTAKATGFSSVSEMLDVKGPDDLGQDKTVKNRGVLPKKVAASNKKPVVASPRKRGKENSFDGNNDSNLHNQPITLIPDEKKPKKMKRDGLKEMHDGSNRDDGPLSKKSNPKKPQISNEISKKEVKTDGKDGDLIGKKNSKKRVLEEASSDLIKKEGKKGKKDSTTRKDARVLDSVKIDNAAAKPNTEGEFCKFKKDNMKFQNADIPLPQGTVLTTVAGIDLPPADVGHALQFLEFCAAFGKVLNVKKGQPESVLRELMRGRSGRRRQYSIIVQFHIQLLSLIHKDLGEVPPSLTNGSNSWLLALRKCVSESKCVLKELPLDCFDRQGDGYDKLDSSKKLRLLNFLCDETLGTAGMRSWIDDQNSKFVGREKEAKEKVLAAKDKEKRLKQKLQDEVAKAIIEKNGAPLSIFEHEAIVSQIKIEAAQAHAEMLEAMDMVPKKKQRSDAVRTEPVLLDVNGCAYWRIKGYSSKQDILLQDIGSWDAVAYDEKWFTYDTEQQKAIEKYISILREKRRRIQKVTDTFLTSEPNS